jgi:crossover junction endodeoxyribonuclease RuvC
MIIAIDPGKTGAMAHLDLDGRFCCVEDMFAVGKLVSPELLANWLRNQSPLEALHVVVEHLSYMPGFGGGSGMFRMGQNYGLVLGVVAALRLSYTTIRPHLWKREMGLTKDKEVSRMKALQLFPEAADSLKRKKDEGRAEALLLGLWFSRRLQVQHDPDSNARTG